MSGQSRCSFRVLGKESCIKVLVVNSKTDASSNFVVCYLRTVSGQREWTVCVIQSLYHLGGITYVLPVMRIHSLPHRAAMLNRSWELVDCGQA